MRSGTIGLLALLCAVAPGVRAEVADASATGFTLKQTVTIKATPQEVYKRIFRVGEWWNSAHSFSGDSKNMTLEERPGGCFCEKLPDGGGVKHLEVVFLAPGKSLVLRGGLGPFLSMATAGALEIKLTATPEGTKFDWSYVVSGYLPAGLNTWAVPADAVITEQFTRLKNWIEHGDPAK